MDPTHTILIVDDNSAGRETLAELLMATEYNLVFASDGLEALTKAAELTPDLILLDVMMPGMDGFEVCRRLRANPHLAEAPVILITALDDHASRLQGLEAGADDFISKPFDKLELRARVRTITRLNRYGSLLAERAKLEQAHRELQEAYEATIEGWSRALELRDNETQDHTQRVTEITLRLARALGISEVELGHIRHGALLHDIGKIAVSDSILLKPGPLTAEEWAIMRRHPTYAYELLSSIAYLHPALDIPYCHHEKWDGTGYPNGLKGEQIPLAARIFSVVDVWDALRFDRPYRPGWPQEKVKEYIQEQAGKHFDPQVVPVFLKMINGE
ncbi:MAG: response regulator [Chloroflexi bacterium]|nr:response regulator [Chloroflexota bacterium]